MDIRYESPATDAPFTRNAEEIAELFFSSATITKSGQFTVISENNVNYIFLQDLKTYADENNNGVYDAGEEVYENYTLMIFVSKDVSYLQKAFEKVEAAPTDVCIFLEDNSTDTFSGSSAWKTDGRTDIFVGDKVRDELSKWVSRNEVSGFNQFSELADQLGISPDFTRKEIKQLIKNGELKNAGRSTGITLFQILNSFQSLGASLYSGLGEILLSASEKLRGYIKFQDYHWDPDAQIPFGKKDEMKDNPDFNPVLIPFSNTIIDEISSFEQGEIEKVIKALKDELKKKQAADKNRLRQFSRLKSVQMVIPEGLLLFSEKCTDITTELIEKLMDTCESIVPALSYLGKKWLNSINAFYCGLWNNLVEAVLGIVDMIGYLFKLTGAAGDLAVNAKEIVQQALEVIDEMIQSFSKINFTDIITKALTEIVSQISKLDFSAWGSSISVEKVSYFMGGLIGFAVQFLVGIFFEAGAGGVETVLNKFGTLGKDFIAFLKLDIKEALGIVAAYTIESLTAIIIKIKEKLEAGAQAIVDLIRYIFDAFKRGFKSIQAMIDEIIRIFGFGSEEVSLIKKLGGEFTTFMGDICKICNKA